MCVFVCIFEVRHSPASFVFRSDGLLIKRNALMLLVLIIHITTHVRTHAQHTTHNTQHTTQSTNTCNINIMLQII